MSESKLKELNAFDSCWLDSDESFGGGAGGVVENEVLVFSSSDFFLA